MPVKKYTDLALKKASPALFFNLPELKYPERLNAVEVVLEGAREAGWLDRVVYYADGGSYTYDAVRHSVQCSARALRRMGVDRGDVVILRIPDTIDLVVTLLAVQTVGAIAMPTYIQLRTEDLVYRANDAEAKFLISTPELLEEALPVAIAREGNTEVLAIPSDPHQRCRAFSDFLSTSDDDTQYADTHGEELCLLLYTSGSTGSPKGTMHCHRDMLAISDTYWRYCLDPKPHDVFAGPPSIAFALGFGMFVYFPLRLGHAAVLEPDKSPAVALEQIKQYRVTIFAAVVSYYNVLARLIREEGTDISSLVHPMTGGEPLTQEVERFWREVTGIPIEQFIGTTEVLHCFLTSTRADGLPTTSTLGRPVPGYEVAVLDTETFKPLPVGKHGLLATRGPTGTVYWRKDDHQRQVVRNGWNVFQDVVWRDEQGDYHYVARHDEMIISAGHNISPVHVESVLLQHDAVFECACVPAPDPTGSRGMIVKAYIVTAEGAQESDALSEALKTHVKTNAPPYMYPRSISFEKSLPKTINGKILRSELKARAQSQDLIR